MLTREFDYIVREGDTLFSIALKFNVPLQTLIELNQLTSPELIYPEQIIKIPVTEEFYQIAELVKSQCSYYCEETLTETAPATEQMENDEDLPRLTFIRYRMRKGDTVYSLAKRYSTTQSNILAVNPNIDDVRNIPIGEVVTIPLPPQNAGIYSVRPGDTLFSIANAQGTTVEKIMDYNFIPSDYIVYPGQQLIIVK